MHDMGGMHGFGQVTAPGGELVFHKPWEARVFALHMVVDFEGLGARPGGRATREQMPPADYLAASYYERWLWSAEQRLERSGTIAPGDVERMMQRLRAGEPAPTHDDHELAQRTVTGLRTARPMDPPPANVRFGPGQRVRVKRMHPAGHTRCPRYVRGAVGVVDAVRGADRLPDRATYGEKVAPEPVYSVVFESTELWGPSDDGAWTIRLDMWDSYLEPAAE
jgi:nitrile hydratase beta subunit